LDIAAALLRSQRRDTTAHMLPANTHSVAATKAGVEQNCNPYSLPRANGPTRLIGGNIFLGPDWKSCAGFERRVFDGLSRIRFDELRFLRPFEQTAHRVQEVPRLEWRLAAPVTSGRDNCRGDR